MYREEQENRPTTSFPSKNFELHSALSKGASELEADPNSVSIIRELMQSDNEWANVQEIITVTFRAFLNVVDSHASALREIENVLPMKANKVDVHSMLNTKANIKDIRKTISEVAQDIEHRTTIDEVRNIIESRVEKLDSKSTGRGEYQNYIIFYRQS